MMPQKHFFFLTFILFYQFSFSQNGNSLFDDTYIHDIRINSLAPYSYQQFHDTLHSSHSKVFSLTDSSLKNYYRASVKIDGVVLDTIGVRYKGNSTFQNADVIGKYPIKLDFNEFVSGQKLDDLKKLNLHNNLLDVSCMRAKLAFEIMKRMGIASPRTAYAKVYINGDYRGLYTMVEQIDKTFVRSNFDPNNTGYLHKSFGFTVGYATSNFSGQDTSDASLAIFMPLKTKKSSQNYQPIRDFVIKANAATDPQFENDIDGVFDLDTFIKQQAVNIVLSDKDHYCTANWNFYMYQNPADNKWYMIPWDYDLAFEAVDGNLILDPADYSSLYDVTSYLTKRMMNIPNLKTQYRKALCEVVTMGMDSIWINKRINTLKNLISTEVENDPHFWSMTNFETYLDQSYTVSASGSNLDGTIIKGIRDYTNKRYAQVVNSLTAHSYTCNLALGIDENDFNLIDKHIVFPNPTEDGAYIMGRELDVSAIKVYNMLGQSIYPNSIKRVDENTVELDLSNLRAKTMYIIKTNTTVNTLYKK